MDDPEQSSLNPGSGKTESFKFNQEMEQQTGQRYKQAELALLKDIQKVQLVLTALGFPLAADIRIPPAPPVTEAIIQYLRRMGRPAPQSKIIRAIGDGRRGSYPNLMRPYGDVWKSLQYHDSKDGVVVCVEYAGKGRLKRGKLQERPRQPRSIGPKVDNASYYLEPDNLFWFRDEIDTYREK